MRASVSSTREPMKPEPRPSNEQGLARAVNLPGALITSSPGVSVGRTHLVEGGVRLTDTLERSF